MRRKTAVIIISFLSAAVVALGSYSWVSYNEAVVYKRNLDANYQHAFGELVTGMSEIDAALQKSVYITSPCMAGSICTELYGKAETAQMSLGVLPFSTQELEQVAGFICHVGDYAFALSRAAAKGAVITDEERENLKSLSETASLLSQNLLALQTDMYDGYLTMDELEASQDRMDEVESQMIPETIGNSMQKIEQEFPEVPSLIYDGPFSQHIVEAKPRLLEDKAEIDVNEGRRLAAEFLGVQQGRVYPTGEAAGKIPAYQYSMEIEGGEMNIAVSKQGGQVIYLLASRMPESSNISVEKAVGIAKQFLQRRGYENMVESYHIITNNVITINFAYEQDGVICYSDLIKVGVAMDNGSVSGFEAMGYISSHYKRDIPAAKVTADQARSKITKDLEILSENMALIPTDGKYEVLCYEFKCQAPDERHFIIYVNSATGDQEKILILLEDENGTLTL
jgi:spore germination protein